MASRQTVSPRRRFLSVVRSESRHAILPVARTRFTRGMPAVHTQFVVTGARPAGAAKRTVPLFSAGDC